MTIGSGIPISQSKAPRIVHLHSLKATCGKNAGRDARFHPFTGEYDGDANLAGRLYHGNSLRLS
jgi:hypothetical protein